MNIGALYGGWLLSPLLGASTIGQDNFSAVFLGAAILLVIVKLVRRGQLR